MTYGWFINKWKTSQEFKKSTFENRLIFVCSYVSFFFTTSRSKFSKHPCMTHLNFLHCCHFRSLASLWSCNIRLMDEVLERRRSWGEERMPCVMASRPFSVIKHRSIRRLPLYFIASASSLFVKLSCFRLGPFILSTVECDNQGDTSLEEVGCCRTKPSDTLKCQRSCCVTKVSNHFVVGVRTLTSNCDELTELVFGVGFKKNK